jgi:large subunit ribosomal protein L3
MNGIVGRKIGMTRIFDQEGNSIPITVVEAGPCAIIQVKTKDKDGYNAVQLGFGSRRKNLFNKPISGHFAKAKVEPKRYLREVRYDTMDKPEAGQEVKVDIFKPGDAVDVTGTSKGLGFQGVVRRYHFAGGPKTHGQSDRLRAPGSIGGSSFPSRTWKGQKMGGRMGGEQVTIKNLEIVLVDSEKNILGIKGAVPGKENGLVIIRKKVAKG